MKTFLGVASLAVLRSKRFLPIGVRWAWRRLWGPRARLILPLGPVLGIALERLKPRLPFLLGDLAAPAGEGSHRRPLFADLLLLPPLKILLF